MGNRPMRRKRRLGIVADEARLKRLDAWLASVMGPVVRSQKKDLSYICQVTDRLFLFLSDERWPKKSIPFVLDARASTLEPFHL